MFCNMCGNACNNNAQFCPNCGNQFSQVNNQLNNKPKKKSKVGKIILLIFLILIVSLILFIYFSSRKPEGQDNYIFSKDYQFLGVTEDNEYIIDGAPQDISFYVTDGTKYRVYEENGSEVDVEYKDYKIYNPNKYKKGKTYIIEIYNGNFTSSQLKETKKVKFKIQRDEVKKYKFSENVINTNTNKISVDNNKMVSNDTYNVGDVVTVYEGEKLVDAYVVTSVLNNNEYEIRDASLNEIYTEFDFYYEEYADLSNYEISSMIEDYVVSSVEDSEWYISLFEKVEAKPKMEIKSSKIKNGIKVDLKLSLDPKEVNPLFKMKNHKIEFSFSHTFSIKTLVDVDLFNWDVKLDVTNTSTFGFTFKNQFVKYNVKEKSKKLLQSLYNSVKNNENSDENTGELKLIEVPIPTPVPGLTVNAGLEIESELKMSAYINFNIKSNTNIVVGFDYGVGEKFKPIGKFEHDIEDTSVTFEGNLNFTVGPEIYLGLDFVGVCEADITMKGGIYVSTKLGITLNSKDKKFEFYHNIDAGLFVELGFEIEIASINNNFKLLNKKFSKYSKENKKVFLYKDEEEENQTSDKIPENNTEENKQEEKQETLDINTLLQNHSCVSYKEGELDYIKVKFNYDDKGTFKGMEIFSSYYINTGIDWIDVLLKVICKMMLLQIDYTYRTFGYFNEYENRIDLIIPISANRAHEVLGISEDVKLDYGYFKAYMESDGYVCK